MWFLPTQARWRKLGHTLGQWMSLFFLLALIIGPILWFIWFIFFTNTFTVQALTVVDARPHTQEAVEKMLQEKVGANMFWLQTPIMEQKLLLSIPQIRDVHIARKLPSGLKIIVQEKEPSLLLLSQRKYYFVDNQGIVYEEARLDTLPGVVLPVVKNNDEEAAVTQGTPVLSSGFIEFVQQVAKELPEITGGNVVEVRIPSLAAREVHFYLHNNWQIRFDVTREVRAQIGILRKLLATNIPPDKQPSLEYIDLRIPQRVYYKLRGSVATPTPKP